MEDIKNKKILVIVESPNKCSTITNILKKAGYTNITVTASLGHIMELGDGGNYHNSGIDPTKEFEPWLTTICVNTYRNTLRRIMKSPVFNTFATTEEKEQVINSVPAPEGSDYSDLYSAIDNLPEKLRLTVLLFYFRDMDIEKTATVLGIPPGTVKSRLNKARKLLKEVLTNESDLQF